VVKHDGTGALQIHARVLVGAEVHHGGYLKEDCREEKDY
jgi:hypothetical protein